MSDFDEDAERERLREKYERDQEKRETTEKMSELLLQGATMTNAHCSECNDPIFRYDGQEFCATCEKPVDRDTSEEGGQEGAIEVTSPRDDARVKFGGDSEQANGDRAEQQAHEQSSSEDTPRQQPASAQSNSEQTRQPGGGQTRQQNRGKPADGRATDERRPAGDTDRPQQRQPRQRSRAGGADIGPIRDSLVRTLQRFSDRAEECQDPQRAREHLAAAREAAETLEALRQ
ncbi:Sjogren's syndrome/scleroderma autoantigen 1 (Autoantigen p27) [Halovenus aranensis]|jgi:uncharacterized Zn finger protein (UPF0148 family)|uniref:Sjogren's syndrome/scleroderma autoantigen 1 (Autoantigen p27) n=1 Tax=Halovenus aranensis TaxID=890420 RepID=A0A1G8VRG9_9EURY|nr:Sjogren's syndrome/scleroderma autoantigen 1 family protein [Halovenus aranensis]SDJ67780.1 Sjogren's syndrome/scleroderma autoantigen 1 (Autoantigen p27) [Halovenus aranensis]